MTVEVPVNGAPVQEQGSDPSKDKESDPAAAMEANAENWDSLDKDVPLQPKKSATQ